MNDKKKTIKKEISEPAYNTGGSASYIYTVPACPVCNETITKKHYQYCPNCGQALDREDE